MKKCPLSLFVSMAILSLGATPSVARADANDASTEVLKPIVFFILDTSGSMNYIFDKNTNNTRLTNALAEIAGGSKNVQSGSQKLKRAACSMRLTLLNDSEINDLKLLDTSGNIDNTGMAYDYCIGDPGKASQCYNYVTNKDECTTIKIDVPYLTNDGKWDFKQKDLSVNAKIPIPLASDAASSYGGTYYDDGVIQSYLNHVKFGFAGLAVGSAGSAVGKDSAIKQAVKTAGGNGDGVLRFTLVWGEDKQNHSDLDSHVYIENQSWSSTSDKHIYFSHTYSSSEDVTLDVDNRNPSSSSASVQMNPPNGPKVGIENIVWTSTRNMTENETFKYKVHNWSLRDDKTNGFRVEIAYKDENGCVSSATLKYNQIIDKDRDDGKYYDVATVKYLGNDKFKLESIASPMEKVDESTATNTPKNIYGYSTFERNGITYGLDLKDKTYKKSSDCSFDMGIWDAESDSEANAAPLVYPSASDDNDDVAAANRRVIQTLRSYKATSATPIGEALADVYYMFGGDGGKVDEGLYRYQNKQHLMDEDELFSCDSRKKSVILISDGDPNGSGLKGTNDNDAELSGHSRNIWYDTAHLYDAGINVYVIGYSEEFKGNGGDPTIANSMAERLNKAAWKGGTCRGNDGKIISPDDEEGFAQFVATYPTHKKTCFYNAVEQNQLRVAIVNALSEITSGVISKTPFVTTTHVSYSNSKNSKGFTNGNYTIYSGYESFVGNQRKSFLSREGTKCDYESGEFKNAPEFKLDFSQMLDERINACRNGMTGTSTSGAPSDGKSEDTKKLKNNLCLDSRVIFAGDYSEERNPLYPKNTSLSDTTLPNHQVKIGFIKDGGYADATQSAKGDYHFLTEKNTYIESETCAAALNSLTNDYRISPYNCFTELECGNDANNKQMLCDKGRCISQEDHAKISTAPSSCITHAQCNSASTDWKTLKVCHNGECVDGTLNACDLRSFIASQRLGVIEYGTPTVVPPPVQAYKGSNYPFFQRKYWNRDTMLLVGANDGMLHSFILGENGGAKGYTEKGTGLFQLDPSIALANNPKRQEGDELWAFIPKSIMPKMRNLINPDLAINVNASPTVADVKVQKSAQYLKDYPDLYPAGCGIGTSPSSTCVEHGWRTVAVGGFRDGARGYYALDVTDPAKPRVLWEIDPTWQPLEKDKIGLSDFAAPFPNVTNAMLVDNFKASQTTTASSDYYPFMQLGRTYAQPLITNVIIDEKNGTSPSSKNPMLTPVAILSGGLSEKSISDKTKSKTRTLAGDDTDYTGRVIYVVQLFPDKPEDLLVKTFYFKNEITGAPSLYPNTFNSKVQHIYVGDSTGAIYRLNLDSTNPEEWGSQRTSKMTWSDEIPFETPVFSPEYVGNMGKVPYEKITHAPAISLFEMEGNRPIIQVGIGTGSNDTLNISDKALNYVGMFFDVPAGDGKYHFNKPGSEKYLSKVIVFNPTDAVKEATEDYVYKLELEEGSSPSDKLDIEQQIALYVTDPSPENHGTAPKLLPHQKMTGAPVIYNFDMYFPTYVSEIPDNKGQCKLGEAYLYKLTNDRAKRHAQLNTGAVQNHQNSTHPDLDKFLNNEVASLALGQGTKVYGIHISEQQYCDSKNGGKFKAPELIVQTGAQSAIQNEQSFTQNSSSNPVQTLSINLQSVKSETYRAKWATVYE